MTLQQLWDKFWFTSIDPKPLGIMRICWSILTIAYIASWMVDIQIWLAGDGILSNPRMAELLQSAADEQPVWLRISPLYWLQAEWQLVGYLLFGVLLSLVAASGVGGRLSALSVWLFVLTLIHRAPMLSGLCEPLLTLGWGYLSIHSGKEQNLFRVGIRDSQPSVAANIALRLFQVHLFAWIILSVASQCGGLVWWQGEAVWWLASEARSPALSLRWLGRNPYALNALTHGVLATQLAALFMLWPLETRKYGVFALWLACGLLILISDQLLYPVAVGLLGLSYWFAKRE